MQPGVYRGTVTSTALAKTKTGKEQIAIQFRFEGGDQMTWFGFFTEAAYPSTEKALEALGWSPAEHDYRFHELNGSNQLHGAEADCVLEMESARDGYDARLRLRWVNAVGGGLVERMEESEAARFAADVRKRCIAWKGASGGASRPASRPPPQQPRPQPRQPRPQPRQGAAPSGGGYDFDDIPF